MYISNEDEIRKIKTIKKLNITYIFNICFNFTFLLVILSVINTDVKLLRK